MIISSSHLKKIIRKETTNQENQKPLLMDLTKKQDYEYFSRLTISHKNLSVRDNYEEQLKEYFAIQNPRLVYHRSFEKYFADYLEEINKKIPLLKHGRWAYFPWLHTLTHILEEKAFYAVRTARNRNLITQEEQDLFYKAVIGIAGLSVGNSVALAIVLQGGARHIRLADHDRLALSNTNRIRAGVDSLGLLKVEVTARQIYLLNPYAEIELFPEGITENNVARFFEGKPPLDMVIDEMDNLAVKCLLREHARRLRLPVLMAADNGDNGVLDIERYDQNSLLPFFHGRMGNVSYKKLRTLDKFKTGRLILKHIGPENVPSRMKRSLRQMGKTLVSWPQLGGAALLNGSAVAYCARKILCRQPIENNRAFISLDEKLSPHKL